MDTPSVKTGQQLYIQQKATHSEERASNQRQTTYTQSLGTHQK